jgi:hypothetical protein
MTQNETQLQYLRNVLSEQLNERAASETRSRHVHQLIQLGTVFLSISITIISGLRSLPLPKEIASDIVMVLGGLSTIIATYGALVSPRLSWHANAEIRQQLLILRAKLEFEERDDNFEENRMAVSKSLFGEYIKVVEGYGKKWLELRRKSQ